MINLVRYHLAMFSLILSACSPATIPVPPSSAATRPPESFVALCQDTQPKERITLSQKANGDQKTWMVTPGPLASESWEGEKIGAEVWSGDLNDDARSDLILSLGNCGNWGDCLYGAFLNCGEGGYLAVWGPDYAQDLRVGEARTEVDGASWRELLHVTRHTPDPGAPVLEDYAVAQTLHFQGRSYQLVPGSEVRLP